MKPSELFGVGVRVLGLVFILLAANNAFALLENVWVGLDFGRDEWRNLVFACLHLCISILLFRKGDWLVEFAYPPRDMRPPNGEDKKQ
jgi:hypothetical protein